MGNYTEFLTSKSSGLLPSSYHLFQPSRSHGIPWACSPILYYCLPVLL